MKTRNEILYDLINKISVKFKYKISSQIENLAPNLSINDINIIDFISNDKKTMTEISNQLHLTPGTVSVIVDKLVKKKYLKRKRDDLIDRRKIFIVLDIKGKKLYNLLLEERLKITKKILKNLDNSNQDKMIDLFEKILLSLE